jgi:serine/threonine protein kinase
MALIVADRFHVKRKLTAGSFGEIYIAIDSTTDREVALKLEPIRSRHPQLESEAAIYQLLEGGVGISVVFWVGREVQFHIIALERLGESLESLKRRIGRPFSLKTVLMIADQTLTRLEFIHRRNIMHRDIKPDNFLVGIGEKQNLIYLIDFGLSTHFRDSVTGAHIQPGEQTSFTGTARYASVNAMSGHKQSRRDDLESLGYVWLYLLKGSLPWQSLPATRENKKDQILQKKTTITIEELCEGVPIEFAEYLRAIGRLAFEDEPHYAEMRNMFRELFVVEGFVFDYKYDWSDLPEAAPRPVLSQVPRMKVRPWASTGVKATLSVGIKAACAASPSPVPLRSPRPLRR